MQPEDPETYDFESLIDSSQTNSETVTEAPLSAELENDTSESLDSKRSFGFSGSFFGQSTKKNAPYVFATTPTTSSTPSPIVEKDHTRLTSVVLQWLNSVQANKSLTPQDRRVWLCPDLVLPHPTLRIYSVLIRQFNQAGQFDLSYDLLNEMKRGPQVCHPSSVTYTDMVTSLARHRRLRQAVEMLREMTEQGGFSPVNGIFSTLCEAMIESKQRGLIRSLISDMVFCSLDERKTLTGTCNLAITYLASTAVQIDSALEVLEEMKNLQIPTNRASYAVLLTKLADYNRTDQLFHLTNEMLDKNVDISFFLYSKILDRLLKDERLDEGMALYERIKTIHRGHVDICIHNTVLSALTRAGKIDQALQVTYLYIYIHASKKI
jgi:pentatricopeptide repeat protein